MEVAIYSVVSKREDLKVSPRFESLVSLLLFGREWDI